MTDPTDRRAGAINLRDAFAAAAPGAFPARLADGPGVSFAHSGLSNAEAMARLVVEADQRDDGDPEQPRRRMRLRDSEIELVVTLEYEGRPRHDAVLYGMTIANRGQRPIPLLTGLLSSDVAFAPLAPLGAPIVHTIGGGVTHYHYPPEAFRLQATQLLGPTELTIESGPTGRSSNRDLPFFFVESGDGSSGLFGGIEWSGLWRYRFRRRDEPMQVHYGHLGPEKSLQLLGGIEEVELTLHPGESFVAPRALLGFYDGSIDDGRNRLRRFLGEWMPDLADGRSMPLIQATPGGYVCPADLTNAAQCLAHARANAEIGAEYYVIECWFADPPGAGRMWGATASCRGTWRPEPTRFPDLKRLAEEIRATGLRFGLWTDMEVVHPASEVARQHPEWVLYLPAPSPLQHPSAAGPATGLLNLGVPAAQEWAIETYDRLVADYGVEWIFYDNNINPAPYWNANEPRHRRGWLQHDYVRGVWRVWDEVRRRHPNVVLENCSSGGRRIDLGTLARAHCHFSSDQFRHAESIRFQMTGANTVLPGDRVMSFMCLGLDDYPDATVHSFFGGFLCITEGVEHWPPVLRASMRRHLEVYKSIRHLLGKDFYPLFAQPGTLRAWEGWQFHDPASGEGLVVLFRGRSPEAEQRVRLGGLPAGADLLLADPYSGEETTHRSADLTRDGLLVGLPPGGSRVLRYQPR
jgi:alpha-galactosidase